MATIAATLAGRIQAAGVDSAKRKPTTDLVAYDYRAARASSGSPLMERKPTRQRAASSSAPLPWTRTTAGACLSSAWSIFSEEWGDAAAERLASCLELASRAVALDPGESRCHRILAMILLSAREFDRADQHSSRALALNPNDGDAVAYRAYILCFLGRPTEALPLIQRAIALNPFYPAWYWTILARALHGAGRHADAIEALGRIERPKFHHHARLAACHGRLGHADEARRFVALTLVAKPDFSTDPGSPPCRSATRPTGNSWPPSCLRRACRLRVEAAASNRRCRLSESTIPRDTFQAVLDSGG